MRVIVILALAALAAASTAYAQTSCYYYQGKQVCCTKVGNNTFCN